MRMRFALVPHACLYSEAVDDKKALNNRFLFVNFSSAEEASRAREAKNGQYAWGVKVRVEVAKPSKTRRAERVGRTAKCMR